MTFDGTQKTIGRGAQAEVFLYHDFAYKVYKPSYPADWISFEKQQQHEINKAGLCPVKYYDTDDSHIIKMDLVHGETLETIIQQCLQIIPAHQLQDNLKTQNPETLPQELLEIIAGYKLLAHAFKFVHAADIQDLAIPHLRDTAALGLTPQEGQRVLTIINQLSDKMKDCVCHLDIHFLNLMLSTMPSTCGNEYTIIDWMNARLAPAVFDYARTWVILQEASKDALAVYNQLVMPDLWAISVSEEDFNSALEVCTIIRACEKNT